MKCVTVNTFYKTSSDTKEPRQVSLWINPDNTVSLLGGLNHGTEIVIDQELVDNLQKIVTMTRIAELEEMRQEYILEHSDIGQRSVSWGELAELQAIAESQWDETDEGKELKALLGED